jgi:hypothetical protein
LISLKESSPPKNLNNTKPSSISQHNHKEELSYAS